MKNIFDLIAAFSISRLLDVLWDVIKKYFIRSYVSIVEHVRSFYIVAVITTLCVLLGFAGFLLLHVGLFWVLSWSEENEGILMLVLAGIYMLVPLVAFFVLHSRSNWLKRTGAQKVLDDVSPKN